MAPPSSGLLSRSSHAVQMFWISVFLLSQHHLVLAFVAPSLSSKVSLHHTHTQSKVYLSHKKNDGGEADRPSSSLSNNNSDRRHFLHQMVGAPTAAALGTAAYLPGISTSHARGLMQFPCSQPLVNRYHFMRAGTSLVEEDDGIWSSNPLFITNREYALSEAGRKVVLQQALKLKSASNPPTLVYHSLAANGIDSADIIGQELQLGRERTLPEFTYLDQRGIGGWNDGSMEEVQPAIWALDAYEASKEGVGGRPPANEDGTPNETLADQFVRLRQFLSLLESRTSGENMLLIFPDGTGPALMSCMIAGIPFYDVHCLEYAPGELRMDISRESILDLYEQKKNDPAYQATLEIGRERLAALRTRGKDVVSLKDQRAEQERLAMEKVYRDKEQQRLSREAADYKLAREKRLNKSKNRARNDNSNSNNQSEGGGSDTDQVPPAAPSNFDVSSTVLAAAGGLGMAGVTIAVGLGSGSDKDSETPKRSAMKPSSSGSNDATVALSASLEANGIDFFKPHNATDAETTTQSANQPANQQKIDNAEDKVEPILSNNEQGGDNTIEQELQGLEAASKAMDTFLEQEEDKAKNSLNNDTNNSSNSGEEDELEKLEAAQQAMDEYLDLDDGYYDWLNVIADIRDEPDNYDEVGSDEDIVAFQEENDVSSGLLQRNSTTVMRS